MSPLAGRECVPCEMQTRAEIDMRKIRKPKDRSSFRVRTKAHTRTMSVSVYARSRSSIPHRRNQSLGSRVDPWLNPCFANRGQHTRRVAWRGLSRSFSRHRCRWIEVKDAQHPTRRRSRKREMANSELSRLRASRKLRSVESMWTAEPSYWSSLHPMHPWQVSRARRADFSPARGTKSVLRAAFTRPAPPPRYPCGIWQFLLPLFISPLHKGPQVVFIRPREMRRQTGACPPVSGTKGCEVFLHGRGCGGET